MAVNEDKNELEKIIIDGLGGSLDTPEKVEKYNKYLETLNAKDEEKEKLKADNEKFKKTIENLNEVVKKFHNGDYAVSYNKDTEDNDITDFIKTPNDAINYYEKYIKDKIKKKR